MAWQRSIPFGYSMENASIRYNSREADAVRQIFSMYLSGQSLGQICDEMARQEIRYHKEKDQWNKSMVYRILDNAHYTGDDTYPQIITETDFRKAREMKAKKSLYAPCPLWVAAVKDQLACGLCGDKMTRCSIGRGMAQWQCSNPECFNTVRLADEEFSRKTKHCFQTLIENPAILSGCRRKASEGSTDQIRIENELSAAFNRSGESPEYLKALIYAVAAEKYKALEDETPVYLLESLCSSEVETLDKRQIQRILDTSIDAVYLYDSRSIALRLLNGKLVTDRGEIR